MINQLIDEQATWPQERWKSMSVEEMRVERLEALRRLEKIETELIEAQRLAVIYDQAGMQLIEKADRLRHEFKERDQDADGATATRRIKETEDLTALGKENLQKASRHVKVAIAKEGEIFQNKSLAMGLASQIKRKVSQWDDWEL